MLESLVSLWIYKALPSLAFAAIVTYLSIPWVEWFSVKMGWVAGYYKSPKSILGGVMIFFGVMVSWLAHDTITIQKVSILGVLLYFVGIGILMDLYRLKGRYKLGLHGFGWYLMGLAGIQVEFWQWAFFDISGSLNWLSWPVTWVLGMVIMNGMGVLRRLDGLVCNYAGILAIVFGVCSLYFGNVDSLVLSMCVAGVCFSFYKYNRNPSRIYLGRSGLYVLGALLTILAIDGVMNRTVSSNVLIVLFMCGITLVLLMVQLKSVFWNRRRRIRSFSYKNKILNKHLFSKTLSKVVLGLLLVSSLIVVTCLIFDIPLLMILIFGAAGIYGSLITGIWFVPNRLLKRLLVCFRY